ncbi:MAG: penicillin-binding protein 1C [Spirochaetaceae bacterium]|jgi:penicillin-binding protein 1C|nr:penicillin-binding protein 1C [Spirochaetaceae bacterium]
MTKKDLIIIGGALLPVAALLIFLLYPLKQPFGESPCSTVIYDRQGRLIQAEIAADDQWRFPYGPVPEKFSRALILYEDKRFYRHWGVRPGSIMRAMYQNLRSGEIVSGGSTLTMQVVRLNRQRERTYRQKIIEIFLAFRWETQLSKEEILNLYSANAPFGGNIVGLEAASYRYFGVPPEMLSWAEVAMLAVLPNAPSQMYPGKNDTLLLGKRDELLNRLYQTDAFDEITLELSLDESIPQRIYSFPTEAAHLLIQAREEGRIGQRIISTIDRELQRKASYVLEKHHRILMQNQIHNAACIILNTRTGETLAYMGNTLPIQGEIHSNQVNNIIASRSTGSTLKPFLYASMVDQGQILPDQLIPDYPLHYRNFTPENYNHRFEGMVPASQALTQSLNVPMVYLLNQYGIDRFQNQLSRMGLELPYSSSHYGLTLIVGGAETSLWELSALYAGMGRTLLRYQESGGYFEDNYHSNRWVLNELKESEIKELYPPASAAALWQTLEKLCEVVRPDEEAGWINFSSSYPMAWKTGTSWGFRDSWAMGVTPEYTIGIWVGNSDGEGRPGNTGSRAAAPILFDMVDILPPTSWFRPPYQEMERETLCTKSHMLAGQNCEETEVQWVPRSLSGGTVCPYHRMVHLDQSGQFQVNSSNYPVNQMLHRKWFVLPPIEQWYYQYYHSDYSRLPPPLALSGTDSSSQVLEWIYPRENSRVIIPVEVDGNRGKLLLHAAHQDEDAAIHWFLNGEYINSTERFHQIELAPPPGEYQVTICDDLGNMKSCSIEVER